MEIGHVRLIDELLDQPYRAVAPSYGVDQVAVLRHALVARGQLLARDVALFALLATTLVGWGAAARDGLTVQAIPWELTVVLLLVAWGAVSFELWWRFHVELALGLSATASRPAEPRAPRSERLRRRLEEVDRQQATNVVVFSNFSPFVGSGDQLDGWAFAIDIEKGTLDRETGRRSTPQAFSIGELYAALTRNLGTLRLAGLRVEERIFINGVDAWRFPSLVPQVGATPSHAGDLDVSDDIRESNRGSARSLLRGGQSRS